ncbi:hypothetical protein ACLIN3_27300 (plasmid) [Pseudomonas orientalis]|uniref:hypothetical protein n=1 Tax=Pseudomonas orientalis TaxID=76758 RepID=UPI00398835D3
MNATDSEVPEVKSGEQKPTSPNRTKVVFVGADLFSVATQHAIAVGYATGTIVSAAKFTQHLVEAYGDQGVKSLTELINAQPKS